MTFTAQIRHQENSPLDRVDLSVVVPLYNERAVLPLLVERLTHVLAPLGVSYELVLVDDGSRDGSGDYLLELAANNPKIKAARLSRNFGKEAALTAGMDLSSGDAVVILDADLQDPPELIGTMLEAMRAGSDIVSMKRRTRAGESWGKRLSAHLFYRLMSRISHFEIPEDTGDFRLMSRRAVNALNSLPERNRYMKGLFAWVGFPTHVIEYDREARAAGTTKWKLLGLIGLALEGITSFSIVPLRWATGLGLLAALIGISFGLWIVIGALFHGNEVAGYPSLIAVITFLGGVQLLSVGLLGEYVGKTYFETKQRPLYVLRDVVQSPRLATPMSTEGTGCAESN
ncbi:MAG: glycosyl transferase [Comamonadaceae bacterium]|nr:MAG: glycosyl transferase [Comamonadaceae bacterium]